MTDAEMTAEVQRPETTIIAAVALLHERGFQGVRVLANFYATGHWRCRVVVSEPGGGDHPSDERSTLLAYTNGMGWDPFPVRTASAIADRLQSAAEQFPAARRPDPRYAAWLAELRLRTGGGSFVMSEDAYTREQMWRERGLVKLLYADRDAAERDAAVHSGVDANGWSLSGTMPTPPPP